MALRRAAAAAAVLSAAVRGGAAAGCDPSKWIAGGYYDGAQLSTSSPASAAECCTKCAADAACVSWAWTYGKYCVTHGAGTGKVVTFANCTAGWAHGDPPQTPAPGAPPATPAPAPAPLTPAPPPTPPPAPHAAVPHGGNAYCRPGNVVAGLEQDGPAAPLQQCFYTAAAATPAPGRRITVAANESLLDAWAGAKCGDTLLLDPAGIWTTDTDSMIFRGKGCGSDRWIWIRSAAPDASLPPEGTRATPCYAGVASLPGRPAYSCPSPERVMPRIYVRKYMNVSLWVDHVRVVGIEFASEPGQGVSSASPILSVIGSTHVIFDRCWIHGGDPDQEACVGIIAHEANYTAVVDSYFSDFKGRGDLCADAMAFIGGCASQHRGLRYQENVHKLVNNFIEAAGEGAIHGGCETHLPPVDIETRRNHFFKPMSWNPGHPSYAGIGWDTKNHYEHKHGHRILVEANVFENVWGGFTQNGMAILLTPILQGNVCNHTLFPCDLPSVKHVAIRYNWIVNAGGLFQFANRQFSKPGLPMMLGKEGNSYSIHDNAAVNLTYPHCHACSNYFMEMTGGSNLSSFRLHDVSIDHNTLLQHPDASAESMQLMIMGGQVANEINLTNSLMPTGQYGIHNGLGPNSPGKCNLPPGGALPDTCTGLMDACWDPYEFSGNVLVGDPAKYRYARPDQYPDHNLFAVDVAALQLEDEATYALSNGSPFKGKAADGRDPGADIPVLVAAVAGVRDS